MSFEAMVRYRSLIGRCELGVGLPWDDIEALSTLESEYAARETIGSRPARRRFVREPVWMSAVIRGDRIHDRVELVELSLCGIALRRAPYIARGERIEVVIEEGRTRFRFCARGVWLREDGDDYHVGLALIGMPVCLHTVAISVHTADLIDQIATAA